MTSGDSELGLAQVGRQFSDLGTALTAADGSGLDPDRVVRFAARSLPHTHHCALTLLRAGARPRTLSATDELPERVDALQYAEGEGPCLDASEGDSIVSSGDLAVDERWSAFGPRCVEETGVRSMLSVQLALGGEDRAAINFYSTAADAFTETDVHLASVIAPFAALAVEQRLRANDADNLHAALTSSRQIGTAIGVIMARRLVTSSEAFELLREASQNLNRKLRDIAAEVEETGSLPSAPAAAEGAAAAGVPPSAAGGEELGR
ncbi:GAF and ANTAR domain-containing protein [Intrasporangium sp. YIM S08009]|uniref:GAF and ANTAR domain-containing protein n=1 Tax=Intrasporangium zincisolvens TaxID=3080018 RepID=UPI002B06086C|nr:GAF and ANTAR domain-containing protein [Intrasporangium sp. YIM S08009]